MGDALQKCRPLYPGIERISAMQMHSRATTHPLARAVVEIMPSRSVPGDGIRPEPCCRGRRPSRDYTRRWPAESSNQRPNRSGRELVALGSKLPSGRPLVGIQVAGAGRQVATVQPASRRHHGRAWKAAISRATMPSLPGQPSLPSPRMIRTIRAPLEVRAVDDGSGFYLSFAPRRRLKNSTASKPALAPSRSTGTTTMQRWHQMR
jgi:hypothetical protein